MEATQLTVARRAKKTASAGGGGGNPLERRIAQLERAQAQLQDNYNKLVDAIPAALDNYYGKSRAHSFVFGAPGSSFVYAPVCTPLKGGLPLYAVYHDAQSGQLGVRRIVAPSVAADQSRAGVFIPGGCCIKIGAEGVVYRAYHPLDGELHLRTSFASCSLISVDTSSDPGFAPPIVKQYAVPLYTQVVVRRQREDEEDGRARDTLSPRHDTLWHVDMAASTFLSHLTTEAGARLPSCFRIAETVARELTAHEMLGPYEEFQSRLALPSERDVLHYMSLPGDDAEEVEEVVDEEIDLSKLRRLREEHARAASSFSDESRHSSDFGGEKRRTRRSARFPTSIRVGDVRVTERDIGVMATFAGWVLSATSSVLATLLRRSRTSHDNASASE